MRSRVQTITPAKATEMLEANRANRPLSRTVVRGFAEAMQRGDWMVTHQGIAFDDTGVLVDGQHRLAAVIEADIPVEMTVFTAVDEGTFDVLDTGKRRNAADVLAMEGEKSSSTLAAMVRIVWMYENRPDQSWSGGGATVTNHQVVQTLAVHPKLRDYVAVGEQISVATGAIKSAAGAASYLASRAGRKAELEEWLDGIIDGVGLAKGDARLVFRRVMFAMARKQPGQAMRRREGREHVALYILGYNAWRAGEKVTSLRFNVRDPLPRLDRTR
ncbi:MAG: hypothetical protein DLM58_00695 [Pseudonocardiales bacterium]|nr:MAG: hypothetical protein DLM58_00695 [Pseudonocardiales bacterium]